MCCIFVHVFECCLILVALCLCSVRLFVLFGMSALFDVVLMCLSLVVLSVCCVRLFVSVAVVLLFLFVFSFVWCFHVFVCVVCWF